MVLSAIYLEIRWKGISNRQRRESLSNMLTNRSFLYLFVLGVSGYVLGSATSYYKFIPKSSIKNELESDLGFRSTKTYAGSPGSHRELLEIDRVQAGSVMNRAGLKKGDLIVVPSPVDEFFRQLNGKRGSTINLTIQRGQSTSQKRLEENKQFSVKIQIPD
jgi:membrane-associated protease RseP (regulator of RpoE activity)